MTERQLVLAQLLPATLFWFADAVATVAVLSSEEKQADPVSEDFSFAPH